MPDCQESLIVNGHFGLKVAGWYSFNQESRLEWMPMDARGDTSSGSLRITNAAATEFEAGATHKAILRLERDTPYTITVDYFIPPDQSTTGSAGVTLLGGAATGRVVGRWERLVATTNIVTGTGEFNTLHLHVRKQGAGPFVVYFDNVIVRR